MLFLSFFNTVVLKAPRYLLLHFVSLIQEGNIAAINKVLLHVALQDFDLMYKIVVAPPWPGLQRHCGKNGWSDWFQLTER